MGFNVDAVNRIIAAISKVETAIQKTKTYRDANIPLFNGQVGEGVNISGILGLLDTQTGLIGEIVGVSNVSISGELDVLTHLISGIVSASNVSISGELDVQTILAGLIEGEASLVATLSAVTRLLAGIVESGSVGGESINLDSQTGFVGACNNGTVVFANLSGTSG